MTAYESELLRELIETRRERDDADRIVKALRLENARLTEERNALRDELRSGRRITGQAAIEQLNAAPDLTPF